MLSGSRKKILFISHDSALTGAPILLLNLIGLIKRYSVCDFEILLYRGGTLEDGFKNLGPTDILKSKSYSAEKRIMKRSFNYFTYRSKLRKWQKKSEKFDFIFSNTIINGPILKFFSKNNIPIISYVHELESVIREYYENANLTFRFSDFLAVPSPVVANNLRQNHSISEKKILQLDYFFPVQDSIKNSVDREEIRQQFFNKFQVPKDKFYVVAMGSATHRKGIDLFLEVCKELKSDPEIFFVWIGDFPDSISREKILNTIESYSISQNLRITGLLPNSPLNLLPFDLFCLTSREDPYPLVVIEAAMQRIPSLCFDSGGMSKFIEGDCGWLIANFSPNAMAEKIKELRNDRAQINKAGSKAYTKAISLHVNEERILLQFKTIINTMLECY